LQQQRQQGEDPTLAPIIRSHDEDDVFDAHHNDEQPHDQRENAEHVQLRRLEPVLGIEALAQRVEGTRTDVAEDDAERDERESSETPATRLRFEGVPRRTNGCEKSAGAGRWLFGCSWSRGLGCRRR
jgi:hypothetical protein